MAKILLTGANGYIGRRLLPVLLDSGHEVIACVRRKASLQDLAHHPGLQLMEIDFLEVGEKQLPEDIDAAYFLIHSMSSTRSGFDELEKIVAENFVQLLNQTRARQIIYLGGLYNAPKLSKHLSSRKTVEEILGRSNAGLTSLRAGIIVGSGSASFEIIRDLVEKLPLMITPRWLRTKCQPIAVRNVIEYLSGVLLKPESYRQSFDIGSTDILTYKEMLLLYAEVRKLRRTILILPVMTPRLSSYWLYFVTSVSYNLAVNLVNSMKVEVVCSENRIRELVPLELLGYKEAIEQAFKTIETDQVPSSWKDAAIAGRYGFQTSSSPKAPVYGCFKDQKNIPITGSTEQVLQNIWSIGGSRGWYYANGLWRFRGLLDKLVGGVGLRRGRTNEKDIHEGDALDFWRVIHADKEHKSLLLYAEMKLPGEAWLEFVIVDSSKPPVLQQTATFRPKGLWGRMYWWLLFPFHVFIFRGMAKNIVRYS